MRGFINFITFVGMDVTVNLDDVECVEINLIELEAHTWGHSQLGYYFSDTRLKEFVALDLVFTMIYYYLINKFYINK